MSLRYFALNKPFGMLSQFVGGHPGLRMLGELDFDFPEGIHAVGRLDFESEGLLLLTTDSSLTRRLFDPTKSHPRSYVVNVYKRPTDEELEELRSGVELYIRGGVDYTSLPAIVERVERPAGLARAGFELKEHIEQDWLRITLTEGKHRQVRKMMRAVRHPVHRLIRTQIGTMELGDLAPGAIREYEGEGYFATLGI